MISHEERKCFESALATAILKRPNFFPAVKQISQKIIQLIEKNRIFLTSTLWLNDALLSQLYSETHFGKLGTTLSQCLLEMTFLDIFSNALKSEENNLPLILHLQQIFMQNIYDILPEKGVDRRACKQEMVKKLFHNELFSEPSRIKTGDEGIYTDIIGTSTQFCPSIGKTEGHQNAIGMFQAHPKSN